MTVYIVVCAPNYDPWTVENVYSTLEAARKAVEAFNDKDYIVVTAQVDVEGSVQEDV